MREAVRAALGVLCLVVVVVVEAGTPLAPPSSPPPPPPSSSSSSSFPPTKTSSTTSPTLTPSSTNATSSSPTSPPYVSSSVWECTGCDLVLALLEEYFPGGGGDGNGPDDPRERSEKEVQGSHKSSTSTSFVDTVPSLSFGSASSEHILTVLLDGCAIYPSRYGISCNHTVSVYGAQIVESLQDGSATLVTVCGSIGLCPKASSPSTSVSTSTYTPPHLSGAVRALVRPVVVVEDEQEQRGNELNKD